MKIRQCFFHNKKASVYVKSSPSKTTSHCASSFIDFFSSSQNHRKFFLHPVSPSPFVSWHFHFKSHHLPHKFRIFPLKPALSSPCPPKFTREVLRKSVKKVFFVCKQSTDNFSPPRSLKKIPLFYFSVEFLISIKFGQVWLI